MTALQPRRSVLVIDSDLDSRDLLFLSLSKEGFVVKAAENRDDGLKLFNDEPMAVIVSALAIKGMSFPDFVKNVRKLDPDVPIILIVNRPEEVNDIDFDTIRSCFVKPLDIDQVLECVRVCLVRK